MQKGVINVVALESLNQHNDNRLVMNYWIHPIWRKGKTDWKYAELVEQTKSMKSN